ncbi:hypothetical protein [Brevundimonas sp. TWP1-2-1b1]|uniref:hypothetical protein n=1 Tax=unclassified Brevundimonas TaxID=2622653 RepID=UPI003CF7A018
MAGEAIIEILSNSGRLQVTGSGGIGYGLSATGALTMNNDGQTHPQPMVVTTVNVTGANPVLAFKANGRINVERISVSGSNYAFALRAQSSNAIGLQYWVFDSAASSIKDPTMAGIVAEIRDEYGVVTFDATMAAMRVVDAIETAKPSSEIPYGNIVNLNDTTTINVPSGRTYAIAQATGCFQFLTYDTGGYSNSETRPNIPIRDADGGDGGGGFYRWRQQALQSYQATSGYTGANTIEVGITRFENFDLGWQPASSTPHNDVHGQARHLIIDVTNFTSAGGISPTIINVGVNATTRSVTTGGAETISQSTTPSVTASVSGGTAPYSYVWQYVSGSTDLSLIGANSATFATTTYSQPAGSIRRAIYRCRVTDAAGFVGFSPDVTFEHVAQAYSVDITPDPLALTNISLYTNEPSGYTNDCDFRVWGINQTINLQFTRGNQWDSGGIFTRRLFIYHSVNNGASWTEYFIGAGAQGVANIAVNNGDRIIMRAYMDTAAGRGDTSFTAFITNTTAGVSLGSITVSGTVDADNNYNNADTTPDTITNWPSINGVVNENDYSWSTDWSGPHYVNGINQPITLRAEVYDYSGNLDALYMDVFTWPPGAGGWTHHGYFAAHVAGPDGLRKLDIGNVVNGTRVAVNPHAITNSGRKSATCRLVLWSITGAGGQFASATQSFVVDNDNNYNVGSGGVSPRDWENVWVYSNNTNGGSSSPNWNQNGAQTIAGLAPGQTATLSLSGYSDGGDALMGAGFIKNGVYQGDAVVSNHYSGSVDSSYANSVTVQNGDTIAIRASVVGFAADQWTTYTSASKTLYLTVSASLGGVLDTLQINGTYTDQWNSGGGGGPIILDPY